MIRLFRREFMQAWFFPGKTKVIRERPDLMFNHAYRGVADIAVVVLKQTK